MNDGYIALTIPSLAFLMAVAGAIWFRNATKKYWAETLDFSRETRSVFRIVSVVALPLLCGVAWSFVDLSEIRKGDVSFANSLVLSLFLCLVVLYACSHAIWHDVEETSHYSRLDLTEKLSHAECERDFFHSLTQHLQKCIGRRNGYLKKILDEQKATSQALWECMSSDYAIECIRDAIDAIRTTYKEIETVPKGCQPTVLLLESRDGYLFHRESFNGTDWECEKKVCDSNREKHFNLDKVKQRINTEGETVCCSVAVKCALDNTIQIVELCDECHDDSANSFSYFKGQLAQQRQSLRSMIAIPIVPTYGPTYVVCLSCSHPMVFLQKHLWKAEQVQTNLQPRLNLLALQEEFSKTLCEESRSAQAKLKSLEQQLRKLQRAQKSKENKNKELSHDPETSQADVGSKEKQLEQPRKSVRGTKQKNPK